MTMILYDKLCTHIVILIRMKHIAAFRLSLHLTHSPPLWTGVNLLQRIVNRSSAQRPADAERVFRFAERLADDEAGERFEVEPVRVDFRLCVDGHVSGEESLAHARLTLHVRE